MFNLSPTHYLNFEPIAIIFLTIFCYDFINFLVFSHIYKLLFINRLLHLSPWCICAYAHIIHYSRLVCWCFILWLQDKPALSACLWSVRKFQCFIFYYVWCGSISKVTQHFFFLCRMVARYAPPISYNFLNLIRLGGNAKTTFEKVIVAIFIDLDCLSNMSISIV